MRSGAGGAPRVTAELNDGVPDGERVNHKRVARVMKAHDLAGIRLRRRVRTTLPEPADQKYPDLLKRDFTAQAPNQRYVGDITCLPLPEGRNLYLATVIDCFSRKLAGWAIADHMRTELVEDALKAACRDRGSLAGAVFHSDHGSTPRLTTPNCAANSASPNPWERSAPAPTTGSSHLGWGPVESAGDQEHA